jgi:O-antigen ligase
LVAAAVGGGVYQAGSWELAERFRQGVDQDRLLVWRMSLEKLDGAHRLAGYGLGAYAAAAPEVVEHWTGLGLKREGMAIYAHNEYLQILVETGVVGFMIVIWGIAALLWAARREPWLCAALAGPAVHAFFEFSFHTPAVGVLLAVVAGLVAPAELHPEGATAST